MEIDFCIDLSLTTARRVCTSRCVARNSDANVQIPTYHVLRRPAQIQFYSKVGRNWLACVFSVLDVETRSQKPELVNPKCHFGHTAKRPRRRKTCVNYWKSGHTCGSEGPGYALSRIPGKSKGYGSSDHRRLNNSFVNPRRLVFLHVGIPSKM